MCIPKVNDIYDEWKTKGFFHFLHYYASTQTPEIEIPFISSSVEANKLDLYYHGTHSGRKYISPLVENIVDTEFADAYFVTVASIFWKLYGENLLKEFAIYSLEYNPIENYNMHESGEDTKEGTDTVTKTGNQTRAMSGQHTTTGTTTSSTQGYDSTTFVDTDQVENSDTTVYGGDGVSGDTETITYNDVQHETEYDTSNGHTLDRTGNIGTMTSQQMIQSEQELWKWNFYTDILFPAVDRVITIPLY